MPLSHSVISPGKIFKLVHLFNDWGDLQINIIGYWLFQVSVEYIGERFSLIEGKYLFFWVKPSQFLNTDGQGQKEAPSYWRTLCWRATRHIGHYKICQVSHHTPDQTERICIFEQGRTETYEFWIFPVFQHWGVCRWITYSWSI